MEYKKIPSDRFDDVILHLRHSFFSDEPLNKAIQLCFPGEGHFDLEKHSLATLEDGLSVMAVTEDNQIAGVSLNGILHRGEIEQAIENLTHIKDEQFKKIFHFLYEENLKLDLFNQFNVDKIFEIRILSVDSSFRGQGLAKKLIKFSEEVAIESGFKMMKADTTGLFSQKTTKALGFYTCSETRYDTYLNEEGVPVFKVHPPHEHFKIMCKSLDETNHNSI